LQRRPRRRDRVAVRDRDEEARRRPAPRLCGEEGAPPARDGAHRADRRRHRADRPARRGHDRERAAGGARARAAGGDPRARARRALVRRHRRRDRGLRGRRAQARQPRPRQRTPADGGPQMNQDFVTTLRLQLRDAAEREAPRGPLQRALPQARPLLLAAVVAAPAAAVALAVGSLGPPKRAPTTTTAPHIVSRLAVADQGGALSTGFGSLWTFDNTGVLRLGTDGSIVARIPIKGDINDAYAGTGGMWALTDDRLYRIDPKTTRIVARIPLPPPSRSFNLVSKPGAGC